MNLDDVRSLPLRLSGWEFETALPAVKKYVCLAVPHTSNWDGVLLIALARTVGMKMSFMIKNDWLRGPMGTILRRFGAVGIERSRSTNVVQAMIDELTRRDSLALVIPPEGTRGRADHWKSGFYHIALGAKVPVVPGYLDYRRKRAGLGDPIWLTGDVTADMDAIRAFYEDKAPVAMYPDQFGPIRLREEAST
ncbi:MAG: acyltransferase [Kofleriaceae bacterium]|nr:MAG: acyltransferase [Kofleriaceae bacterium]MBZ0235563.1 acyltransferase [Kofleriaceae bacterium]